MYDVVDFAHGLYARMRIEVLLTVQAGSLGMQAQNIGIIDNSNTLHTGKPIWGRPGVSPTGGTRQDLQQTQQTHSLHSGKIFICSRTRSHRGSSGNNEVGFQRRHIKLSAWGTRCRQWPRSFERRNIKVLAWGSCCQQRSGSFFFVLSRI